MHSNRMPSEAVLREERVIFEHKIYNPNTGDDDDKTNFILENQVVSVSAPGGDANPRETSLLCFLLLESTRNFLSY